MSTTERTRLALEALTKSKAKSIVPKSTGANGSQQQNAQFIRYTPGQQGGSGGTQRIIKMTEAARDPLEPPVIDSRRSLPVHLPRLHPFCDHHHAKSPLKNKRTG